MAKLENEILLCLFKHDRQISSATLKTEIFPTQEDEENSSNAFDNAINNLKSHKLIIEHGSNYQLEPKAKEDMQKLPVKYKGNPYGYFLSKLRIAEKTESRKNWKQRNWFWIAIISAIGASILTEILNNMDKIIKLFKH